MDHHNYFGLGLDLRGTEYEGFCIFIANLTIMNKKSAERF